MAQFDKNTLARLSAQNKVAIRTEKHPDSAVVIWVAVADGEVFVRSARGAKGRWYRDVADGGTATLEFDGHALPVRAVAAADSQSIEARAGSICGSTAAVPVQSVVRPDILSTTLRLEPR